jgi:RNA polymerase sigma-70 factor (ECF subfamily)
MANDPDESTTSLSDNDIVTRILSGEVDLYHLLVRRYNRRLYHVAWSILQNEQEAEDVIQEAYVRAYEHLSEFAGRSQFSTWLTKIAIHEAFSRIKRLSKEEKIDLASALLGKSFSTSHSTEQRLLTAEARSALEYAINALPEAQRTAFVMHFIDEVTIADIAECLDVSKDVVKMRILRARRMLRHKLYKLARATSATAFQFLGERCDRVSARVRSRIANIVNGPPH